MSHIQPRLDIATIRAAAEPATATITDVLSRIVADRNRAIIEVNPDALVLAKYAQTAVNPHPLAGIPIALKDNIDTGDRMQTTAGSPALLTSRARRDAFAITQLRHTGAIPVAKANMSEWANFRAAHSSSGYSGRGGQCLNPHDHTRCPSGSSSGSAAAVAAGLVPLTIGSETDGSIISPSARCGVVGIKPTVGLISRSGVIPISTTQDTLGTHARTVADAALLLGVLAGYDANDAATHQIPATTLATLRSPINPQTIRQVRIGVARANFSGYHAGVDARFDAVVTLLARHGITIVDNVEITTINELRSSENEYMVMCYEFKQAIAAYLATREVLPGFSEADVPRTLSDLIAFNDAHPNPGFAFDQEIFLRANRMTTADKAAYRKAAAWCKRKSQPEGIDATLQRHNLDCIIVPAGTPAWPIDQINGDPNMRGDSTTAAACAAYPLITIPMGKINHLPIGLTLMGTAWSDATLVAVAHGIEQLLLQEGITQ